MNKELIVAAFLLTAAMFDLRFKRIPNVLVASGLLTGLFLNITEYGIYGLPVFIRSALAPVLLLFVLFFIRALGAADIKVFSVISTMLSAKEMIDVTLLSFFIGALLSLLRILLDGTYPQRTRLLLSYAGMCLREGRLLPYETIEGSKSYICFSVCIFFSYMICEVLKLF